jgi:tetratricopeptide (TPR) repeat protein
MDITRAKWCWALALLGGFVISPARSAAEDAGKSAAKPAEESNADEDMPGKIVQAAKALRKADKHDEADKFLREAIAICEEKLKQKPDSAKFHFALAQFQAELGQSEAASESIKRAIALQSNCRAMYCFQGFLLASLKEYEAAETALRKALELKPSHVETRNCLVVCLFNLNRKLGAVEFARETVRLAPNDGSAVRMLASIQFVTGNQREWERTLRSAIERNSNDIAMRADFAEGLDLLQRQSEAYAQHVEIAKLRPGDIDNERMLVYYATVARMLPESQQHAERLYDFRKNGKYHEAGFARDHFYAASKRVRAIEYFEPHGEAGYKYVFSVRNMGDKEEFRIVLGTYDKLNEHFRSEGKLKDGEVVFALNSIHGKEQQHYGVYPTLPTYEQARALAIEIIEGTRLPNLPSANAEKNTPERR